MRLFIPILLAASLSVPAAAQRPPREESPAPRDLIDALSAEPLGDEIEAAIAAADRYPLGTSDNPVRVGGPEGERAYLSRLRCSDGKVPRIGTRAEAGVGAFGSLVGSYAIDCGAAAPGKISLVFDIYHEEYAETRLPPGFSR